MKLKELEATQRQVKSQEGKLTADHLEVVNGKRGELPGLLQKRHGHPNEEAEQEIDLWIKQLK